MFEPDARVLCTEDEWVNALGDEHQEMRRGYPGTVVNRKNWYGIVLLEFEEFPDQWFWSAGFKRRLDG